MNYCATVYGLCENDEPDGYEFSDSLPDAPPEHEWPPAGFTYTLARVGAVWVESNDDRIAAGKGWIELVGQERAQRARELNLLPFYIDAQIALRSIAGQLRPTSLGPGGYVLDNGVECWVICVEVKPQDSYLYRRLPRGPLDNWLSRPSDPTDIFRSIGSPPGN